MEFFLKREIFWFLIECLPGVAQPDGFFWVAQLQEVPLDGIAVDLQGFGGLNDIAVINHKPMEEVMALEILRLKAAFPQTI